MLRRVRYPTVLSSRAFVTFSTASSTRTPMASSSGLQHPSQLQQPQHHHEPLHLHDDVMSSRRSAMFAPIAYYMTHELHWGKVRSRLLRLNATRLLAPFRLRAEKPPTPNNNNNDKNNKDENDKKESEDPEDEMTAKINFFVFGAFVASYILYRFALPSGEHTGWATIANIADKITNIDLYEHYIQITTDEKSYYLGVYDDEHTNEKLTKIHERYTPDQDVHFDIVGTPLAEKVLFGFGIVAWVVPFIFFPSFVMILTRAMGTAVSAAGEGGRSSKLKQMNFTVQYSSNTRFTDIAGMREAKREITEIVDFLKEPTRFTRLGAKIPTGALLLGPPGTGKTLLAKAVAGEAGIGFIPVVGSDFVELYVGMGALRVRQLFELAKKQRCIVYIDEIDAIGMKRSGAGHGEKQEQEHTLNELLTQLDGFGSSRGQVMILASSNVPQNQLDPALIRPGRFDRIVHVDAPVVNERVEIFKVHLCKLKLIADEEAQPVVAEPSEQQRTIVASDNGGDGDATTTSNTTTATTTTPTPSKDNLATTSALDKDSKKPSPAELLGGVVPPAISLIDPIGEALRSAPPPSSTPVQPDVAPPPPPPAAEVVPDASSSAPPPVDMMTTGAATANQPPTQTALAVSTLGAPPSTSHARDVEGDESSSSKQQQKDMNFDLQALLSTKTETERALIAQYADRMSGLCPGFVGADIANVCNEAAILAARENCTHVSISHLERSIDRVLAGIEHRSRVLSDFEKRVVAHHEAGHAIAGWFLGRADPLMKVSIVPRGGSALGYAQYLPNENKCRTANEIFDSICVTLGGRVAETIFFNHLSTGASDDLQKVCRMAYAHVTSFGSGATVYHPQGSQATRYVKPYGASTADRMDEKAKALVDKAYEATLALLTSKKFEMELLAKHLLEHELLTYEDVVKYLGPRQGRDADRKRAV